MDPNIQTWLNQPRHRGAEPGLEREMVAYRLPADRFGPRLDRALRRLLSVPLITLGARLGTGGRPGDPIPGIDPAQRAPKPRTGSG